MADKMPAEIWIGGKVPRKLLDSFPVSDLYLDWDECPLKDTSEQELLAVLDDDLLHLMRHEVAWGVFQEIEFITTACGDPLIPKKELVLTLEAMGVLCKSKKSLSAQVRSWRRLYDELVELIPEQLPPLPVFEIVDKR